MAVINTLIQVNVVMSLAPEVAARNLPAYLACLFSVQCGIISEVEGQES